jgi:hypothetical protein
MSRAYRAAPVPVLLLLLGTTAGAWQPETRVRMVDEAVRLMPGTLRVVLETRRESVLRGMLEPMVDEDGPAHRPSWDGGTLDLQIGLSAQSLVDAVDSTAPFDDVAKRFGELAHYVADSGFPPTASGEAGVARYAHFARFCESRRDRFPLVFYGHDDPDLDRDDFDAFTLRILRESRSEDRELARAYRAAGDPPSMTAFDDRSIPFAIGSLSYSRTVTYIVRAWIAAWDGAHGDLGRTPYMPPAGTTPESTHGRPGS